MSYESIMCGCNQSYYYFLLHFYTQHTILFIFFTPMFHSFQKSIHPAKYWFIATMNIPMPSATSTTSITSIFLASSITRLISLRTGVIAFAPSYIARSLSHLHNRFSPSLAATAAYRPAISLLLPSIHMVGTIWFSRLWYQFHFDMQIITLLNVEHTHRRNRSLLRNSQEWPCQTHSLLTVSSSPFHGLQWHWIKHCTTIIALWCYGK